MQGGQKITICCQTAVYSAMNRWLMELQGFLWWTRHTDTENILTPFLTSKLMEPAWENTDEHFPFGGNIWPILCLHFRGLNKSLFQDLHLEGWEGPCGFLIGLCQASFEHRQSSLFSPPPIHLQQRIAYVAFKGDWTVKCPKLCSWHLQVGQKIWLRTSEQLPIRVNQPI